jgi:hypothetical protein
MGKKWLCRSARNLPKRWSVFGASPPQTPPVLPKTVLPGPPRTARRLGRIRPEQPQNVGARVWRCCVGVCGAAHATRALAHPPWPCHTPWPQTSPQPPLGSTHCPPASSSAHHCWCHLWQPPAWQQPLARWLAGCAPPSPPQGPGRAKNGTHPGLARALAKQDFECLELDQSAANQAAHGGCQWPGLPQACTPTTGSPRWWWGACSKLTPFWPAIWWPWPLGWFGPLHQPCECPPRLCTIAPHALPSPPCPEAKVASHTATLAHAQVLALKGLQGCRLEMPVLGGPALKVQGPPHGGLSVGGWGTGGSPCAKGPSLGPAQAKHLAGTTTGMVAPAKHLPKVPPKLCQTRAQHVPQTLPNTRPKSSPVCHELHKTSQNALSCLGRFPTGLGRFGVAPTSLWPACRKNEKYNWWCPFACALGGWLQGGCSLWCVGLV